MHRRSASLAAITLALVVSSGLAPDGLTAPARAQSAVGHPEWPGKGQLFVGTCYQPVDRSPDQIQQDIAIMKAAGFNLVRMGDLSWDSFEPEEGRFTFEWFDKVIDQMHQAGIRVIVDIPGEPAPISSHAPSGVETPKAFTGTLRSSSSAWRFRTIETVRA